MLNSKPWSVQIIGIAAPLLGDMPSLGQRQLQPLRLPFG